MTWSPTWRLDELVTVNGTSSLCGASVESTARSSSSEPKHFGGVSVSILEGDCDVYAAVYYVVVCDYDVLAV